MDAIEAILTRRSVRKFAERSVPPDTVERLLEAAMAAPSARNAQPWHFIVIDDRPTLLEIAGRFPNAEAARHAPLGILICGDLTLELSKGYWIIDCAAAAQNLLLAAHAMGLGGLWTGVYPREQRVEGLRELLRVPDHVVPHSLLLFGYPAETPPHVRRYNRDRIHRNRW